MNIYETTAIVEDQGQIRVAGLPFMPGTQVGITISPIVPSEDAVTPSDEDALAAAHDRMRELFRTIKGFRMAPRIAREELYERGRVH